MPQVCVLGNGCFLLTPPRPSGEVCYQRVEPFAIGVGLTFGSRYGSPHWSAFPLHVRW